MRKKLILISKDIKLSYYVSKIIGNLEFYTQSNDQHIGKQN